jgi:hypothetical protein
VRAECAERLAAVPGRAVEPFNEEAMVDPSKELRRERLYTAYEEAVSDPEYAAEMAEVDRDFDVAVADGLGDEQDVW